jgi:DNA-binding response OmpR family regulator
MNILVVDNDKDFREAWVRLLRESDYNVTFFESLKGQTPRDLHNNHPDLALIDRRVDDDQDIYDTSGQQFAVSLCELGTPTVLVTGFLPSYFDLFELLRTGAISAIATKKIEMFELLHCVEEFKHSRRFPNCVAEFYFKEQHEVMTEMDWREIASKIEGVDVSGVELSVLFRSVIPPCAQIVKLDPMTPGHGGAALFRAKVSSGDGPVVEDVAIKYGDRNTIMSEAMRYDRHVGPLPDGVAAHLRWRKETRKLGAIAYTWVGDSVEDGVPFGPAKGPLSWRRRQSALDRLFSVSLNPWYRVFRSSAAKPPNPLPLLSYYTGLDGYCTEVPFSNRALPDNLPSPVIAEDDYWDFGQYGRFPSPVNWLTEGPGSTLQLTQYSPCHGDLHVKNIFVLPDDSPRLIDFGDTALGHVFRDFAALETSIRLTCCNMTALEILTRLEILKTAADSVSRTTSLGEHINHRPIPRDLTDVRKTVATTMQIRRAALDAISFNASETSLNEYLFALILRLLRYATGIADEVSSKESADEKNIRVWHALYSAARATQQAISLDADNPR